MSKVPTHREAGFTLVEVLVALTILAIALSVLLHVLSESLHRTRESQNETAASAFAQSLLADAGRSLPLRVGDTAGQIPGGFTWRLNVAPYGNETDRKAWTMNALVLSASVGWNDGSKSKWVTLTTLRAAGKEREQ